MKKLILLSIKGLSLALVFAVFFTNSVFAYSQESNFWKERKTQLATLPTSLNMPNVIPAKLGKTLYTPPSLPSKGEESPHVFHIQDIHLNSEAQNNIAKLIQQLVKENEVDFIALEGAFAPIDIRVYREFSHQDAIHKVARYFLKTHKMAGPLFSALTSSKAYPDLVGIDDATHYFKNVEAYKDSVSTKDTTLTAIQKQWLQNQEKKKSVLNPDLQRFDSHVSLYQNETLPLTAYINGLTQFSNTLSSTLSKFKTAIELERELNFTVVEKERRKLISALLPKLTPDQTTKLMASSMALRAGQIAPNAFYRQFKELCTTSKISLQPYTEFRMYLTYLKLSDSIKADQLFKEMKMIEKKIYSSLIKTDQEKELVNESNQLALAKKLVTHSLTKDEWGEYKKFRSFPHLSSFEDFYRHAEARDAAISTNLIREIERRDAKRIILVTGGFHTAGIQTHLKEKGISSSKVTPKISKIESYDGAHYLSAFTQEKTALENLFDGKKLFLSQQVTTPMLTRLFKALTITTVEADDPKVPLGPARTDQFETDLRADFDIQTRDAPVGAAATLVFDGQALSVQVHMDRRGELISIEPLKRISGTVMNFFASVSSWFRWIPNLFRQSNTTQDRYRDMPILDFLNVVGLEDDDFVESITTSVEPLENGASTRRIDLSLAQDGNRQAKLGILQSQLDPNTNLYEILYDENGYLIAIMPVQDQQMGDQYNYKLFNLFWYITSTKEGPVTAAKYHEWETLVLEHAFPIGPNLSKNPYVTFLPQSNPYVRVTFDYNESPYIPDVNILHDHDFDEEVRQSNGQTHLDFAVLPTVYNPKARSGDWGYYSSIQDLPMVYNTVMESRGRPERWMKQADRPDSKKDRFLIVGPGSGLDFVAGYLSWLHHNGITLDEAHNNPDRQPFFRLRDINPFAVERVRRIAKKLGLADSSFVIDVGDNIPTDEEPFDYFFWNMPFNNGIDELDEGDFRSRHDGGEGARIAAEMVRDRLPTTLTQSGIAILWNTISEENRKLFEGPNQEMDSMLMMDFDFPGAMPFNMFFVIHNRQKSNLEDPGDFSQRDSHTQLRSKPFSLLQHYFFGTVLLVLGYIFTFTMGFDMTAYFHWMSYSGLLFLGGIISLSKAFLGTAAYFTFDKSPSDALIEENKDRFDRVRKLVSWGFAEAELKTDRNPKNGWLGEMEWSTTEAPSIRIASWLIIPQKGFTQELLRRILLPFVLAHELGRLWVASALSHLHLPQTGLQTLFIFAFKPLLLVYTFVLIIVSRLQRMKPMGVIMLATVLISIMFGFYHFQDFIYALSILDWYGAINSLARTVAGFVFSLYLVRVALVSLAVVGTNLKSILRGTTKVNQKNFANIPLDKEFPVQNYPNITIHLPVFNEDFPNVIRHTFDEARAAVAAYNKHLGELAKEQGYQGAMPRANLVVSDDALLYWSNNDLDNFVQRARVKLQAVDDAGFLDNPHNGEESYRNYLLKAQQDSVISEQEAETLMRLDYYERHNLGVISRPKPIDGEPLTVRFGHFKKPGNLNYALKLEQQIREREQMRYSVSANAAIEERLEAGSAASRAEALEQIQLEPNGYHYKLGWFRGDTTIAPGDNGVLHQVDKDSRIPEMVFAPTAKEFIENPNLGFTQHRTVPTNEDDNIVAKAIGYSTRLHHAVILPVNALLGGQVEFVGHNGFVRRKALEEIGLWNEMGPAEDFDMALQMTAKGYDGKFIAYEGMDFGESVGMILSEEAGRFARIAYSIIALVFNPFTQFSKKGIFRKEFVEYWKSPHITWSQRIEPLWHFNFMLAHGMIMFFGFLMALNAPLGSTLMTAFLSTLLIFNFLWLPAAIAVGTVKEAAGEKAPYGGLFSVLGSMLILGVVWTVTSVKILYGLFIYAIGGRPNFGTTQFDDLSHVSGWEILAGMWREHRLFFKIMGILSVILLIHYLTPLKLVGVVSLPVFLLTLAAVGSYIGHPYLMNFFFGWILTPFKYFQKIFQKKFEYAKEDGIQKDFPFVEEEEKKSFWKRFNWQILFVFVVALATRLYIVTGERWHMDESFYVIAHNFGNTFVMSGDVHLWPTLAAIADPIGGLFAVRLVTVVLGSLTVIFIYKIAQQFSHDFTRKDSNNFVPFFAALVYAISAPALFTSTLGTHDSLAYLFYSIAFYVMLRGIKENKSQKLTFAAIFVLLAISSRYMMFMFLPVILAYAFFLAAMKKGNVKILHFIGAVAIIVALYWLFNISTLPDALAHSGNVGRLTRIRLGYTPISVFIEIMSRIYPIVILTITAMILYFKHGAENLKKRIDLFFIFGASLFVALYHVATSSQVGMEKNIAMTFFFGSIPAGMVFHRLIHISKSTIKKIAMIFALLAALFLYLIWIAYPQILSDRNWAETKNIETATELVIQTEPTDETILVWANKDYIAPGLTRRLDFRVNERKETGRKVRVDMSSPWYGKYPEDILHMGLEKGVDVMVGTYPSQTLHPGDRIYNRGKDNENPTHYYEVKSVPIDTTNLAKRTYVWQLKEVQPGDLAQEGLIPPVDPRTGHRSPFIQRVARSEQPVVDFLQYHLERGVKEADLIKQVVDKDQPLVLVGGETGINFDYLRMVTLLRERMTNMDAILIPANREFQTAIQNYMAGQDYPSTIGKANQTLKAKGHLIPTKALLDYAKKNRLRVFAVGEKRDDVSLESITIGDEIGNLIGTHRVKSAVYLGRFRELHDNGSGFGVIDVLERDPNVKFKSIFLLHPKKSKQLADSEPAFVNSTIRGGFRVRSDRARVIFQRDPNNFEQAFYWEGVHAVLIQEEKKRPPAPGKNKNKNRKKGGNGGVLPEGSALLGSSWVSRWILSPLFEEVTGLHRVHSSIIVAFLPFGYTILPLAFGGIAVALGAGTFLSMTVFTLVLITTRLNFIYRHPDGLRQDPWLISILMITVGPILASLFTLSGLGLVFTGLAMISIHMLFNMASDLLTPDETKQARRLVASLMLMKKLKEGRADPALVEAQINELLDESISTTDLNALDGRLQFLSSDGLDQEKLNRALQREFNRVFGQNVDQANIESLVFDLATFGQWSSTKTVLHESRDTQLSVVSIQKPMTDDELARLIAHIKGNGSTSSTRFLLLVDPSLTALQKNLSNELELLKNVQIELDQSSFDVDESGRPVFELLTFENLYQSELESAASVRFILQNGVHVDFDGIQNDRLKSALFILINGALAIKFSAPQLQNTLDLARQIAIQA